jgi:SAM-dependent methyltransferase
VGTWPGWERWRAQLADALTPVRGWLIRELAARSGETVLELGAGTGETGLEAAALLGDDGRLISTDFVPAMIEAARRHGIELGLSNVDYRVIDAERIELDAGSVDGVLCQSTYMLVADGHIAPPEPEAPGVFSLASEERTQAILDGAGFGSVRTEEVPVRFAFRDLADYERWVLDVTGPFAVVVRGLPEDERELLRARLTEAFRPFSADEVASSPESRGGKGRRAAGGPRGRAARSRAHSRPCDRAGSRCGERLASRGTAT